MRSKLREWIYLNGMYMKDFAKLLGVSRISVFHWAKGRMRPCPPTMKKIQELTNGQIKYPEDVLDRKTPKRS